MIAFVVVIAVGLFFTAPAMARVFGINGTSMHLGDINDHTILAGENLIFGEINSLSDMIGAGDSPGSLMLFQHGLGAGVRESVYRVTNDGSVWASEYCDQSGANCSSPPFEDDGLWVQSGSNIYYDAGVVGIGTDSPGTTLEVQDNVNGSQAIIRVTDTNDNPEMQLQYGIAADDYWSMYVKTESSGGDDSFRILGGSVDQMVISQVGDVTFSGSVQVGESIATCTADLYGSLRYDSAGGQLQSCTSDGWGDVGGNGGDSTIECTNVKVTGKSWACPADFPVLSSIDSNIGRCCKGVAGASTPTMILGGLFVDDNVLSNPNGGNIVLDNDTQLNGSLTMTGDLNVGGSMTISNQINGTITEASRLTGTENCLDNQVVRYDAASASWSCSNDAVGISNSGELDYYTMVIAMNEGYNCPAGFTEEQVSDLHGYVSNDYVYIRINNSGLFLTANANNESYGTEFIFAGFDKDNGPDKVCHRTYTSYSQPHTSVILAEPVGTCPSGYTAILHEAIAGNNTWSYLMGNDAGMYIGYRDTWNYGSDQESGDGYVARQWHPAFVNNLCFKVMGVEEDPATRTGVFPVILGVRDPATCSALGYNVADASKFSEDQNIYIQWTDNASIIGPSYGAYHGGDNYGYVYFTDNRVENICWKYYVTDGSPRASARIYNSKTCPAGYIGFDPVSLKGDNNWGYHQQTSHGLYLGGLYSWDVRDERNGWVRTDWTTHIDSSLFCLNIENALN